MSFSYARRLKNIKPGRVQHLKFKDRKVKIYIGPKGRKLHILRAPKSVKSDLVNADKVYVRDGTLVATTKPKAPFTPPTPAPPAPAPKPRPVPKEVPPPPTPPLPKEEFSPPSPPTKPPKRPEPTPPQERVKKLGHPKQLTEAERKRARLVPVPDKGPIPTPYIDWSAIPEHCKVSGVTYLDYQISSAPKGMLPELREMLKRSRRYQNYAPVNLLIQGPKGTGKSELIKAFAQDSGLPYWSIIGQEGIRADELLGHYELKEGTSRWVGGIIPRAVRCGGILHIDEPNVIEPAILMRLDELLDNKRQLNMEDLNGEIVKGHPDLFIVFTMNPPTYEGVKDLPDPIKSRLTKRYYLGYPPKWIEMQILKRKMRLSDREFKPPSGSTGSATGKLAQDIEDVLKIVDGLRKETDLTYTPSLRETQGFIQDLKEGDDFFTAFDRNIKSIYYGEEADRIEEALRAVRRR